MYSYRNEPKTRITADMTTMDMFMAMSNGNPGALNVLMQLMKADAIDPDNFLGGLGAILSLDTYNYYGSRIWMLYKDLCGQDLVKMIGVLRAMQLGIVDSRLVARAVGTDEVRGEHELVNVDELLAKVKERLPKFGQV